ncbi:hypothetical protein JW948_10225 [bacterium]|nr:hypothetical protein [bacterium]
MGKISVKIDDIIEGIEAQGDMNSVYLDMDSGKVHYISEDAYFESEDGDDDLDGLSDWEMENVEMSREIMDTDRFKYLPDRSDVDEYGLMEKFIGAVEDSSVRNELKEAIQGKGAFRRFKDRVHHHHLENEWYEYRDSAIRAIAIAWCEENSIDFIE